MKKNGKFLSLLVLLSSIAGLSSCGDNSSIKVNKINFTSPMKDTYSYGEVIDLSEVNLEVTYSNKETKEFNALDNDVEVSGIDTEETGNHRAEFKIDGFVKEWDYTVVNHYLTLNPMGGEINGSTEDVHLTFYNNQVDISNYIPLKFDEDGNELVFSGWFFDENLMERATYLVPDVFMYSDNVTLYAGYDTKKSDLYNYTINKKDQTATLVGLNEEYIISHPDVLFSLSNLVIPKTVEGYVVAEIAPSFMDSSTGMFGIGSFIEEISFEEGSQVTTIGDKAFAHLMYLTKISFPETLKYIGEEAFTESKLSQDLVIPKNVERIGNRAFSYSSGYLEKVVFEEGSKLQVIGEQCFAGDVYLYDIKLPEGLKEIRDEAFSGCNEITSLVLPASTRIIGSGTFLLMESLKEIVVDSNNPYFVSVDGNLYSKDMTKLIRYCYGNNKAEFDLPKTVKRIEKGAFKIRNMSTSLKKLNLNEGLSYIGDEAFGGCSFTFVLPESLNSFSLTAFKDYEGNSFEINSSNSKYSCEDGILYSKDKSILYAVPQYYENPHIELNTSVETISDYAFCSLINVRSIVIPEDSKLSLVKAHGLMLCSCKNLNSLEINLKRMFSYSSNSFYSSGYAVNDGFVVCFKYDNCRNEFSSGNFDGKADMTGGIISQNRIVENTISLIESNPDFQFTSYSSYRRGVEPLFLGDLDLFKSDLNKILSRLSIIYRNHLYTNENIEYFAYFERKIEIEFFRKYVQTKSINQNSIALYRKLVERYSFFPDEVKSVVSNIYTEIATRFIFLTEESKQALFERIVSFSTDDDDYNDAECKRILSDVDDNGLLGLTLPNQIVLKINAMDVSSQIHDVLEWKNGNHEDVYNMYLLVTPNENNNYFSLPAFIDGWFSTEHRKEMIYHSDEFETFYQGIDAFFSNESLKIANDIDAFDFEKTYNFDEYLDFYNSTLQYYFAYYPYSGTDATMQNIYRILADIEIGSLLDYFGNDPDDYENRYSPAYYDNLCVIDTYLSNLTEENREKVYSIDKYDSLENYILNRIDTQVQDLKARIKNFRITSDNLSSYFEELNGELLSFGNYFDLFFGDGLTEEEPYDYVDKYLVLYVSYISDQMFRKYPTISDNNINEQKKEAFGYFDLDTFEYYEGFYDEVNNCIGKIQDIASIYRYSDFMTRLNELKDKK